MFVLRLVTDIQGSAIKAIPYVIANLVDPSSRLEGFAGAWGQHLETQVKSAFAEIIGEPTVPKDWAGESSDLFTSRLVIDGQRISTAFLLKGPARFHPMTPADLGQIGVPEDWVDDIHNASEDRFFELTDRIPAEAAEALLDYAATGILRRPGAVEPGASAFDHPDAQRWFRVLDDVEELKRALTYPWNRWTIFLHPLPAARGELGIQRPSACLRLRGDRENRRRAAPHRRRFEEVSTISTRSLIHRVRRRML